MRPASSLSAGGREGAGSFVEIFGCATQGVRDAVYFASFNDQS